MKPDGNGFYVCAACGRAFRRTDSGENGGSAAVRRTESTENAVSDGAGTSAAAALLDAVVRTAHEARKGYVKGRFWLTRVAAAGFLTVWSCLVLCASLAAGESGALFAIGYGIMICAVAIGAAGVAVALISRDNEVHRGVLIGIVSADGALNVAGFVMTAASGGVGQAVILVVISAVFALMAVFVMVGGCEIGRKNNGILMLKKNYIPSVPPAELLSVEKRSDILSLVALTIFAVVAFVIVCVGVTRPAAGISDPLRNASDVSLGSDYGTVSGVMGVSPAGEDGDVRIWYDGEYTELLKEAESLVRELEYVESADEALDIMRKLAALEEEIEKTAHTTFTVVFSDGKATDISLTNQFGDGSEPAKELRADKCSYKVSSDRFFEEGDGFYIEITRVWSDGSWRKSYSEAYITAMLYDELADSYTVECEIALDGENTRNFSVTASKTEWQVSYGFTKITEYYEAHFGRTV